MSAWLIVGLCMTPSACVALLLVVAVVRYRLDDRDRRRRIAWLVAREQRDAAPIERFARLCGQYAPTAAEIADLPEVEPRRRVA